MQPQSVRLEVPGLVLAVKAGMTKVRHWKGLGADRCRPMKCNYRIRLGEHGLSMWLALPSYILSNIGWQIRHAASVLQPTDLRGSRRNLPQATKFGQPIVGRRIETGRESVFCITRETETSYCSWMMSGRNERLSKASECDNGRQWPQ